MGLPLKALTTLSILSLAHSIYSAYEATILITPSSTSSTTTTTTTTQTATHPQVPHIPLDIRIQTLLSTFLLLICIVLSAPELRPIRWNEWAGRIEREGWDPNMEGSASRSSAAGGSGSAVGASEKIGSKGGAGNPYQMLELRRGFWDVRGSRERFAGWVRSGEGR